MYGASQQIRFDSTGVTLYAFRVPISGANVAYSEHRGHVEAFVPLSGSHQLKFIPSVTGNFQVSIIYYSVGMLWVFCLRQLNLKRKRLTPQLYAQALNPPNFMRKRLTPKFSEYFVLDLFIKFGGVVFWAL